MARIRIGDIVEIQGSRHWPLTGKRGKVVAIRMFDRTVNLPNPAYEVAIDVGVTPFSGVELKVCSPIDATRPDTGPEIFLPGRVDFR